MSCGHSRSAGQLSLNHLNVRSAVSVWHPRRFPLFKFAKKSPFPKTRIEIAQCMTP